jgi:acetyl esterase/lipase
MPRHWLQALPIALLLAGCDNGSDGNNGSPDPDPPDPQPGELIGEATLRGTFSPPELLALAATDEFTQAILEEALSPRCAISVYHFEYQTEDPAGETTPASGALMLPNDSATGCQGERPVVLYAHGTNTDRDYDLSDLESSDNTEALLVAGMLAAEGYIVVAPNYVGYDTSTLGYHPYLNGEQQSKDMIDALTAARSALPLAEAPDTTDGGKLLVTGYSQGGFVAMATHRALQDAGETVTASAPMSGPYALTAFSDAIFQGRVTGASPVSFTLLLTSYQRAYGDLYDDPEEAFEPQYAREIEGLLPSTASLSELVGDGKIPDTALFSSTPPDPAYADVTPATEPASLAPVFALGFGEDHLLTNDFRLAYLEDAAVNPDGGFPAVTDGLPPAEPANPLRLALKANDQRSWIPDAPVLLCAGHGDPAVLYLNTELMQAHWASAGDVTVLDIDSDVESGDRYEDEKEGFAAVKALVELAGGDDDVLENYHAGLVAPFCLRAARRFFDGF